MLYLPQHKVLFVTPGKCGSTTLHETFPNHIIGPQGPWRRHGFCYPDAFGKHTCIIPYEYYGYRQLLVCREEHDYLESLHKHFCRTYSVNVSLEQFKDLREQWRDDCVLGYWFYWYNMYDYICEQPTIERIALDKLDVFIKDLTGVTLPKLNASQ